MHVSWLRRKLGDDAGDPKRIVTVRGVGLRFES
jgi:DNA-binding response OmpR family regulator